MLGSDFGVPEITIGVFCEFEKLNNGSGILGMSRARGRKGELAVGAAHPQPRVGARRAARLRRSPPATRGERRPFPPSALRSVASECSWSCLKGAAPEAPLETSAALR